MKANVLKAVVSLAVAGLVSAAVSPAFAGAIADGTYKGQGLWKSPSEKGSYEVATMITGNRVEARYKLADGSEKAWDFEMVSRSNGFFDVKTHGLEVGQGYCLESAAVCHYEIKINDFSLEETITLMDGKLYRFGSRSVGKEQTVWQEMAERK